MKNLLNCIKLKTVVLFAFLVGCAGIQRECSGCNAETFGADWVVVQMDMNGHPFRCWTLRNTSITNESQSDGIWWQSQDGNLVHISGFYNRVQVTNGNWQSAYRQVGVTEQTCRAISETLLNNNIRD